MSKGGGFDDWRKRVREAAADSGPKKPYEECDHEFDEDEDAGEYVCNVCGDREPIPLDRIIRGRG